MVAVPKTSFISLPLTQLQPAYVADFHCTGTRCEDTCCAGWGIVIDKGTYDKYQNCPDIELKTVMDRAVLPRTVPNGKSAPAAAYAQMTLTRENACPFLTNERLCAIQKRLGAEALSRTCAVYPRILNRVDGVVETSLSLSCPEAARLALLNPEPMGFIVPPDPGALPMPTATLDTDSPDHPGKPYRHFGAVRTFILSLLQNRDYWLWERLVILGMFCDQLNQIADNTDVLTVIASFTEHIGAGLFRDALASVTAQPQAQMQFLIKSFDHRLASDATGARFVDCYWEFREGIGYTPDATDEAAAHGYARASADYFKPFMDRHAHILENYVVNHVFKTLFPFGPQTSLYFEQKSFYEEYVLLIVHYALVRSLLVGMAGCHGETFGAEHVMRGVQSFARTLEHDLPTLKSITGSLTEQGLDDLAFLAVLVKD